MIAINNAPFLVILMTLLADERIEELRDWKPYGIDLEIPHETINSSMDDQTPKVEQFHPLSPSHTDYTEMPFKSNNSHPESGDAFFLDKVERIKQVILETISEMKSRQRLNEFFIQGIDSKVASFLHDLDELKHWSLGNNPSIETRRIHLEKEVLQLEKEKRINNLNCWRDLLLLKKDLREALSEYKSLMRFKEILS